MPARSNTSRTRYESVNSQLSNVSNLTDYTLSSDRPMPDEEDLSASETEVKQVVDFFLDDTENTENNQCDTSEHSSYLDFNIAALQTEHRYEQCEQTEPSHTAQRHCANECQIQNTCNCFSQGRFQSQICQRPQLCRSRHGTGMHTSRSTPNGCCCHNQSFNKTRRRIRSQSWCYESPGQKNDELCPLPRPCGNTLNTEHILNGRGKGGGPEYSSVEKDNFEQLQLRLTQLESIEKNRKKNVEGISNFEQLQLRLTQLESIEESRKQNAEEIKSKLTDIEKRNKYLTIFCVIVSFLCLGLIIVFIILKARPPTDPEDFPEVPKYQFSQQFCAKCTELGSKEETSTMLSSDNKTCCFDGVQQMFGLIKNKTSKFREMVEWTSDHLKGVVERIQRGNASYVRPFLQVESLELEHHHHFKKHHYHRKKYITLNWFKNQFYNQGGILLLDSSTVRVPETGHYFIYSRVHFWNTSTVNQILPLSLSHAIFKECFDKSCKDELQASVSERCTVPTYGQIEHTSVLESSLYLNKYDTLYVSVRESTWEKLNKQSKAHVFGIFKL